jgi:hypothetical protein
MNDRSGEMQSARTVSTVQRSLGELFGELSQEFGNLIHQELQLAKDELRGEAANVRGSGNLLLAAGLAAVLCVAFVGAGIAWGLAEIMPIGWAFALVGVVFGAAAFFLYQRTQSAGTDAAAKAEALPIGPIEGDRF